MNSYEAGTHLTQNDFGELLRTVRIRRGATQRQLADLSTVSVRAIRDLETGRAQRPRPDTVRLIADGLALAGRSRSAFEMAARAAAGGDPDADAFDGPPPILDTLLGRDRDSATLSELLITGDQRLVTVVGVGGVGKTRLAQHVAASLHAAGTVQVRWASRDDDPADVSTRTEAAIRRTDRPTLLVLDGCEPDRDVAARLTDLLADCPSLRLLVTSREPFELVGERTLPLGPLALPPQPTERSGGSMQVAGIAHFPAVALLIRYIQQVRPGFQPEARDVAVLAALCRQLDGIPSALEVAASWLLVYESAELLERVRTDPFTVVSRDVFDDLLRADLAEQALLGRLTELDGPWSIPEAVAFTGASMTSCQRLVHRLVIRGGASLASDADRPRFRLLELLRAVFRCRSIRLAEAN